MNTLYKHSDIPIGAIYSYDHSDGMTNYFLKLRNDEYVNLNQESKWTTYTPKKWADKDGTKAVTPYRYKIVARSLGAVLAKVEKEIEG